MNLSLFDASQTQEVIDLFTKVFSASEGDEEGQSIGNLVSNLIAKTGQEDLLGCTAMEDERIVACIFFSRFAVPSGQVAFMLSPVAVDTHCQGTGIGQQLINFGLDQLRSLNVELAFTYGNPAYYSKTGFEQISENTVKAPFPLSQPFGWLAQSLDGSAINAMQGDTQCVEAFNNPDYW